MKKPTPIELIKASTTIIEILELYAGVTFKNVNRTKLCIMCPFHKDKNPSMTVYTDSNKCCCWKGCGNRKQMDMFDVVAFIRGVSTSEAIKIILHDLKLSTGKINDSKVIKNIESNRINNTFQKEFNSALSYVNKIITDIKVFIRNNIYTLYDLDIFGNVYHQLDRYYQLECMLQSGDMETKKRAISEVKRLFERNINK
ncbi:CHC2 zinc finger domain-containing protein [Bacillus sp. AFS017336]|uniref:CHC2 zinc finger domain-containing protein n=1 Tax=Bacillus sp. AFS017336 TaxID=2033489 RepID=UPI000BF0A117|nr:CHC2 zinc finger domain-containing protein [Bacillus sp. AFS017336]PEL07791.1 hypothetical protein CN601_19055 [Bacillus sp. AFS017336]